MKRIIWIATPLLSKDGTHGGKYVHLLQWARNIDKEENEITLVYSKASKAGEERIDEFRNIGINAVEIPELRHYRLVLIPAILKILKLTKSSKAEIIHSISLQGEIVGAIVKILLNRRIRLVGSVEGRPINENLAKWKAFIYRMIYPFVRSMVDEYIAISKNTKDILCESLFVNRSKVSVVYSGINKERFDFSRFIKVSTDRIRDKTPIIAYYGRLLEEKGVFALIEAMPFVLENVPKAKLLIVGGGKDELECKRRAIMNGIAANVVFRAFVDDIGTIMEDFDIYVLPSRSEGIPWSILESMAAAKVVIAASVGGIPEIIQNGKNGILLEDCNPETVAERIVDVVERADDYSRMAGEARHTVEEQFTIEGEMKNIERIYCRLVEGIQHKRN